MDLKDHVVNSEAGKLTGDTSREDVTRIISRALAHPGDGGIVFHFHGGLVSKKKGEGVARHLGEKLEEADAYPVFSVWEAGLFETLQHNLKDIAGEALFKLVWKRVLKIVRRKIKKQLGGIKAGGLPGVGDDELKDDERLIDDSDRDILLLMRDDDVQVPENMEELTAVEAQQLETELQFDFELLQEVEAVSRGLMSDEELAAAAGRKSGRRVASSASLMDPAALEQYIDRPDPDAKGVISTAKFIQAIVKIAVNVIQRYIRGRSHGFHATMVEEILHALYVGNAGGIVWGEMKKDTFDAFGANPNLFAGTALLQELKDQYTPGSPPKITLTGHSTGAVYISAFLAAADRLLPAEFVFDVVYLAPAATMKLTAATLADHGARIRNFRMFTMTDENEKKDVLVPILYPHSLLYFVSGVVEPEKDMPLTGMNRFYDAARFPDEEFPDSAAVRAYIAGDRAAWSVSDGPAGRRTAALKHGDFDNETNTIASLQHILLNGF
jgi:hypothetical protein